jgi:hypothetical protein
MFEQFVTFEHFLKLNNFKIWTNFGCEKFEILKKNYIWTNIKFEQNLNLNKF